MSLLALLLGAVMSGSTVIEYGNQPLDTVSIEQVSPQQIRHVGFSSEDPRQLMVQEAYSLGGMDFVLMLECENGNRNPSARGDSGRSVGLCQMNTRRHKLPQEYYDNWRYQIDLCYQKWKSGTKFYGPNRKIKGVKCKDLVRNRFILN